MKRTIFPFFILVITALFVPFLSAPEMRIHAVTQQVAVPTPIPVSPILSTPPVVEYVLPYPGILPTHPLYFFKMIRDQIVEALISDPVKKADFYITQADKKLSMALALSDVKKSKEMISAVEDAMVLRQKSVTQLEEVRAAKQELPGYVLDQLSRSLVKHLEVLTQLKQGKDAVQALVKRSMNLASGK